MKKILFSLMALMLVLGLVGAGAMAYYYDTEQSTNNSMAAGTLDLDVDNTDAAVTTVSVSNKAPGDSGAGSTDLDNSGSLSGELDIATGAITNTESSGATEYEADDAPGELGANLKMVLWIDVGQDGSFGVGDIELVNDGSTDPYDAQNNPSLTYVVANTYDSDSWDAVETMASGASDDFVISWDIPTGTGNDIQGDSMSFDVTFTLEQAGRD